jgi:hypothetical protein
MRSRLCCAERCWDVCRACCKLKVETVGVGGILFVQMAAGPSTMITPRSRSRLHRALFREVAKVMQEIRKINWKRRIPRTLRLIQIDSKSGWCLVSVGLGIAGIFARLAAMRCVERG